MRTLFQSIVCGFIASAMTGFAGAAPPVPAKAPATAPAATPAPQSIEARDVRPHVYHLASPEMRGRGDFASRAVAANYIVDEFRKLKLKPLFEQNRFHQDVPGVRDENGEE